MEKIKITVIRKARYDDLIEKYENPIEHPCDLKEGQVFICENSAQAEPVITKKETVPKHGLGLKIIQGIVEKYEGTMITDTEDDRFVLQIVLPLI